MFDEEQKVPVKIEKKDVEQLFQSPPKSKSSKIAKGILKWGGLLILILIFGFGLVNGPALYKNAKYYVYINLLNKSYPSKVTTIIVSADQAKTGENNHLIIPRIGVNSPVQWNIDQTQLKDKLKNGLVHLNGSNLPSDPSGNVFIIGHSSYYWWVNNPAASVFCLLHNLQINDKILLTYNNNGYVYQISSIANMKSGQIEVEKPSNKKQLTLMTYSPMGTYLNKLLITANFVSSTQPQIPIKDKVDSVEKFTEDKAGISPTPITSPRSTVSPTTSPLPANTNLKFLPDTN